MVQSAPENRPCDRIKERPRHGQQRELAGTSFFIWILPGHGEVVTGFAGFFTILALFHLILPGPTGGGSLSDHIGQNRLTLFYSRACKSCEEIETLCKERNILIYRVDADEHFGLLEQMDIYDIPVLFVNDPEEKRCLIGKKKIQGYLSGAK